MLSDTVGVQRCTWSLEQNPELLVESYLDIVPSLVVTSERETAVFDLPYV